MKTCDFFVGIGEFLSINFDIIPPSVSILKESGATSIKTYGLRYSLFTPFRIAACMAAP